MIIITTEPRRFEALPLRGADGKVCAWYCGGCGVHISDMAPDAQDTLARICVCPKPCVDCGAPQEDRRARCSECSRRKRAERDAKRIERAAEVTAESCGDDVQWNLFGGDECTFAVDLGDLADDNPGEEWAVPCPLRPVAAPDARALLEDACEEHHESCADVPREAVRELQAFLDEWFSKHTSGSYFPDETRKVRLPKAPAMCAEDARPTCAECRCALDDDETSRDGLCDECAAVVADALEARR